jgi:hypothetical protein
VCARITAANTHTHTHIYTRQHKQKRKRRKTGGDGQRIENATTTTTAQIKRQLSKHEKAGRGARGGGQENARTGLLSLSLPPSLSLCVTTTSKAKLTQNKR